MSSMVPVDPSDSLLSVLPDELVQQLVKAHGVMVASRLVSQAVQEAMSRNLLDGVFTAASTVDMATRMVVSSPAMTPELMNRFGVMQDEYVEKVQQAVSTANNTVLAQQHETLNAARRNGQG